MKKTTINVRGFDTDFDITIKKKDYLNIEEAENYVRENITSTAMIKSVIHHTECGLVKLVNQFYGLNKNIII